MVNRNARSCFVLIIGTFILYVCLLSYDALRFSCDQTAEVEPNPEQPASQASTSTTETSEFSHTCITLPDYSEICLYKNACVQDGSLLLPESKQIYSKNEGIDMYMNLPYEYRPPTNPLQILPVRSFLEIKRSNHVADEFHYNFGFLTGFDSQNDNIFHFSESLLLFHSMKMLNGSAFNLPPLDIALLNRRATSSAWINTLSSVVFDGRPIMWEDQLKSGRLMCFRQLAIGGTIIHLNLGVRDAEELRANVYKKLDIPQPVRQKPSNFILIEERAQRSWKNKNDIIEVIKSTGIPYEVVSFANLDFKDQVRMISKAGVFVSAHGAGLTNVLWMATGTAVLEVFPSKVWQYNLYGEIARNAGLFHVSAYGQVENSPFENAFSNPLQCLSDYPCNVGLKQDFHLDPARFRERLDQALLLAGLK